MPNPGFFCAVSMDLFLSLIDWFVSFLLSLSPVLCSSFFLSYFSFFWFSNSSLCSFVSFYPVSISLFLNPCFNHFLSLIPSPSPYLYFMFLCLYFSFPISQYLFHFISPLLICPYFSLSSCSLTPSLTHLLWDHDSFFIVLLIFSYLSSFSVPSLLSLLSPLSFLSLYIFLCSFSSLC